MNIKSPEAFRTISEVSKDLSLPQHVLRFWEKHFNEIKPSLIYKGRRYYSYKNIEYIKKVKKLLKDDGYTIKGSKKLLTNNNNHVDSLSGDNINTKKILNLKNKIKELKKYLNG